MNNTYASSAPLSKVAHLREAAALFLLLFIMSLSSVCASAAGKPSFRLGKKGEASISITPDAGRWTYSISRDGRTLIEASTLGFKDGRGVLHPSADWNVGEVKKSTHKGVWKPVWGKRELVDDSYSQFTLPFTSPDSDECITLTVRVYADGVAFRYQVAGATMPLQEATDWRFAQNYNAWFYNGERHNVSETVEESQGERWPVMVVDAKGCFMALHEADLQEGEPLCLTSEKGSRTFCVASAARDMKQGFRSAWRVVMCAGKIGTLVDSHLLELLNPEPAEGSDFTWVKPGVAVWDWRIDGAVWDGFRYSMSYPSWTRMIDFAARNRLAHLVLDANWYGPEFSKDSDPLKGDKAKDVRNIIQYGKEHGVGVWLYINDVAGMNYPIEETLAQYGQWGASGVKYGFMNGTPEEKNIKTRHITELCARNHLLVDFHDYPVHPYGQMRTFPNAVTREYCKAQLDGHDIFYPETFVTSVFVNMIAGPIDMNNGMFDLRQGRTTRVDNNQEVPSTVVAEAARTQITFSGATVIPDIPEYYEKYPSLLRFIASQQMPWKESRTLAGEIGKYIVMMRQASDGKYLIGAATNEEGRTIDVPLDFLPKGTFTAEITEDGADAHYLTNRESIKVRSCKVTRKSTITLTLASGGGGCVVIE